MRLGWVAIAAGAIALVGFNAAYLISAGGGQVHWCIPYLEGCVSISKAGRQAPAIFLYRASIIPAATLMVLYWGLNYRWLAALGAARSPLPRLVLVFGVIGALSLIVYGAILGSTQPEVRVLRRHGAINFFALTGIAQIMLTVCIRRAARAGALALPGALLGIKIAIAWALGLFAVANIVITYYDINPAQNVIEWNVATLMTIYFMSTAWAWRATRFDARSSDPG